MSVQPNHKNKKPKIHTAANADRKARKKDKIANLFGKIKPEYIKPAEKEPEPEPEAKNGPTDPVEIVEIKADEPDKTSPLDVKGDFGPLGKPKKTSPAKHYTLMGFIGGIAAAVVLVAAAWYTGGKISGTLKPAPQDINNRNSPTTTPTPDLKSEFIIDVLNGSGRSGQARINADKLLGLGFRIGRVGNASSSNLEKNILEVSPGTAEKYANLISQISSEFKVATVTAEITGDTTASAVLIIGRN